MEENLSEPPPRASRRGWRWVWRVALGLVLLLTIATLIWLRGALYRHFVTFPKEEAAWAALREQRQPVPPLAAWTEYRGVLHSHSELSHDSEVPFEAILSALQETRTDFICLSDHCHEGKADFSRQWRGLHEGKLFIPGFEMKEGLMPFGVASAVVLENRMGADAIARAVIANGGVLFYAHPEEPRVWDRPELTGMEIYNIHADFKDEGNALVRLLPDLLVNQSRYPEHVFRLLFDRPTANLRRWDQLNLSRRITGIAGNDCHQNTGVRVVCTATNTVRIEETSPKTLREFRLNPVTRGLLRLCFGPLEPGRRLFHLQLDPYPRMARFVGTHVLARELTEPAILDALRAGRAFVGFDTLADSSGFQWTAETGAGRAVLGESMRFAPNVRLRARSPVPCRFTVLKDGEAVHQGEGRALEWTPPGAGRYRVEAELNVRGAWTPWVYANPIRLE